jgi:hypothetical protein
MARMIRMPVAPVMSEYDVVKLHVHLHERLLHVLNVGGGILDQAFAMAQIGPQPHHSVARAEAAPQQAVLVELLEPLGILHIGFAARDMLDVARIHEQDLEAAGFKDLEDRNPIHARRFHGDRRDTGLLEPIGQSMEIPAKRPEGTNRLFLSVGGYGDDMERRPDIEPSRIRVDRAELP